jgi:hypothetical protein
MGGLSSRLPFLALGAETEIATSGSNTRSTCSGDAGAIVDELELHAGTPPSDV